MATPLGSSIAENHFNQSPKIKIMSVGTLILTIIVFGLLVTVVLFVLSFILPIGSGKSNIHGSAEFTRQSVLDFGNQGWIIDGDERALSRQDSYAHLLLIAPTGSGKTTRYSIPNLLQLDDCSIVCTDPKGDLFEITGDALRQRGYRVLLFDAEQPEQSQHFNPLFRLNDDADYQHFANSLIDIENQGAQTEAVWRLGSARILQALITTLKNLPDQRYCNMAVLVQLMKSLNSPKTHQLIKQYGDEDTKEWFADWIVKPDKTRESQVITGQSVLTRFDTQKVKHLTADDSFDFNALRREKTAIFLKVPSGDPSRLGLIISIFYSQLFRHLLSTKLAPSDLGIMAILEEFGNLSVIPNFESVIALIRSKRVGLALVCQDLHQIHSLYKSNANTIISNCSSILAYPGIKDPATLNYLTKLLGRTTIEIKTEGHRPQLLGRNLLNEDEIRTLERSAGLFIHGNNYGEKVATLPIYQNKPLMKKFGLQSIAGELVPKSIIEQPHIELSEKFVRLPLEEKPKARLEQNLDQIFDDTF
jgi:type IV secretory pathway TraG/TraD family ATPase VirD4